MYYILNYAKDYLVPRRQPLLLLWLPFGWSQIRNRDCVVSWECVESHMLNVSESTCFSLNDLFCFLWTAFLRTAMLNALFFAFSCAYQTVSVSWCPNHMEALLSLYDRTSPIVLLHNRTSLLCCCIRGSSLWCTYVYDETFTISLVCKSWERCEHTVSIVRTFLTLLVVLA